MTAYVKDAAASLRIEKANTASISLRELALFTGVTCAAAQLLSYTSDSAIGLSQASVGAVIGQAIWNAAQVGFIILVLGLWVVQRTRWMTALGAVTVLWLPFAVYALGPGGRAMGAVMMATAVTTWLTRPSKLELQITDAPARGAALIMKFELLAFVSTLFCSMYNFRVNNGLWPHWASIYAAIGNATGFTVDQATIAHAIYTLGISGISFPKFIYVGASVSGLGALTFTLIWTLLPALYVMYFAVLAKLAENSPGTRVQQTLCAFCIFHFLFLTDLVDYRYGRGLENEAATWAHWMEVFVWRVAILLPIYQKIASGDWWHRNGLAGRALTLVVGSFGAFFFVHEVILVDVLRFAHFMNNELYTPSRPLFGYRPAALAYHGALVLMTFVYAFSLFFLRCKRISTVSVERGR